VQDVATGAAALLLDDADIRDMRVNELRVQLTLIGLSSEGRKPELVERLLAARVDARRRTAEVPVAAAATLEMVAAEASKAATTTSATTAAAAMIFRTKALLLGINNNIFKIDTWHPHHCLSRPFVVMELH
jgi:hypothetical protein